MIAVQLYFLQAMRVCGSCQAVIVLLTSSLSSNVYSSFIICYTVLYHVDIFKMVSNCCAKTFLPAYMSVTAVQFANLLEAMFYCRLNLSLRIFPMCWYLTMTSSATLWACLSWVSLDSLLQNFQVPSYIFCYDIHELPNCIFILCWHPMVLSH